MELVAVGVHCGLLKRYTDDLCK